MKPCGFAGCTKPATVYGGWPNAGDWACYACDAHKVTPGFSVWDILNKPLGVLFP